MRTTPPQRRGPVEHAARPQPLARLARPIDDSGSAAWRAASACSSPPWQSASTSTTSRAAPSPSRSWVDSRSFPCSSSGLLGGVIVDAVDRRATLIVCSVIAFGSTVGLAVLAFAGVTELAGYYLLTTLGSTAGTLVGTARFAILPRLVPRHQLPAASALSGISAGTAGRVRPDARGSARGARRLRTTYSIDALLYAIGFLGIITLPSIPPSAGRPATRAPRRARRCALRRHRALPASRDRHARGRGRAVAPPRAVPRDRRDTARRRLRSRSGRSPRPRRSACS